MDTILRKHTQITFKFLLIDILHRQVMMYTYVLKIVYVRHYKT